MSNIINYYQKHSSFLHSNAREEGAYNENEGQLNYSLQELFVKGILWMPSDKV